MKTAILVLFMTAIFLASCKKDEPTPPESNVYTFSNVTSADTLTNETYYFQVSIGDTLDSTGLDLTDYDNTLYLSGATVPQSIYINPDTLSIAGKYCVMMSYYFDSGTPVFVNSSFYLTKGNDLLYSECAHSGHCVPFLVQN